MLLFLYQLQVRRHNDSGMYDAATKASKQASLYVKIGIVIGSISWAVGLFFSFVVIVVNVLSVVLDV